MCIFYVIHQSLFWFSLHDIYGSLVWWHALVVKCMPAPLTNITAYRSFLLDLEQLTIDMSVYNAIQIKLTMNDIFVYYTHPQFISI